MKYELIDHGPEHSQYFQGCGTAFTQYDECATGIGNDPREALDDCLDSIAQQTSSAFVQELERRILADFPAFNDDAKIEANTVDADDFELWYHISIRYCHPENLDALSIDPKDYDEYAANEDNPEALRDYAAGKATAMRCRLQGDITTALKEEQRIDRIYNQLPEHLKW